MIQVVKKYLDMPEISAVEVSHNYRRQNQLCTNGDVYLILEMDVVTEKLVKDIQHNSLDNVILIPPVHKHRNCKIYSLFETIVVYRLGKK